MDKEYKMKEAEEEAELERMIAEEEAQEAAKKN